MTRIESLVEELRAIQAIRNLIVQLPNLSQDVEDSLDDKQNSVEHELQNLLGFEVGDYERLYSFIKV